MRVWICMRLYRERLRRHRYRRLMNVLALSMSAFVLVEGCKGYKQMANVSARAELQVIDSQPSGELRAHHNRWIVRCKVIRVVSGSFPTGQAEITLLMHSPTKTFSTNVDDLPLYVFSVEFTDPVTDPYAGDVNVLGWRTL